MVYAKNYLEYLCIASMTIYNLHVSRLSAFKNKKTPNFKIMHSTFNIKTVLKNSECFEINLRGISAYNYSNTAKTNKFKKMLFCHFTLQVPEPCVKIIPAKFRRLQ